MCPRYSLRNESKQTVEQVLDVPVVEVPVCCSCLLVVVGVVVLLLLLLFVVVARCC